MGLAPVYITAHISNSLHAIHLSKKQIENLEKNESEVNNKLEVTIIGAFPYESRPI